MDEVHAFDMYHEAFRPADTRPGAVFAARWFQGPLGLQEERFADRRDALAHADKMRRIYGPQSGASVVALSAKVSE